MHASPVPSQQWPTPQPSQPNPWLEHLGRGMWLRAHLSTFAIGSVLLLTINLLRGSGGVWADTAIGAWSVLILAHGILLLIARLLRELLAEDEAAPIRPSSEMRWTPQSTWGLPQGNEASPPSPAGPADPSGAATMTPEDAAQAATAARERGSKWPRGRRKPDTDEPERVSWQAATDAAWLAPRPESSAADKKTTESDDDFTPLKFD